MLPSSLLTLSSCFRGSYGYTCLLGLHFDAVLHGKAVLKLSHLCRKKLDFHFKNVTRRIAVTSNT